MRRSVTPSTTLAIAIVLVALAIWNPFVSPVPVQRVLGATGSATIAAPNVQVGTTSSTTATITLTEGAAGDYPAASTVTVVISIFDGAGNDRLGFVGTPVISAPGSVGNRTATVGAGALDNQLTISWEKSDILSTEPIQVTGLRISAASNAVAGVIRAFYSTSSIPANYYGSGSWTAAGSLTNAEPVGSTTLEITADAGTFPFAPSGSGNGLLSIAAPNAESVGVIAVGGGPVLTTNPIGFAHAAGTRVSQTVAIAGTLTTIPIATPAGILTQTSVGATTVTAGQTNQAAGTARLVETVQGTIPAGTIVTYSLALAGVQFTTAPTADPDSRMGVASLALGAPAACALNVARTSCSVTVTAASSGGPGSIDLTGIRLDVAPGVPASSQVGLAVSTNPSVTVSVTDRNVAIVSAPLTATSLAGVGTAAGVSTSGPFAITTRLAPVGRYVTWKVQLAPAMAGARVEIWVATNTGAGWSAFTRITTRLTDASGAAYYWRKSPIAQRISVRGYFAGDPTHAPAWSPARQARWR